MGGKSQPKATSNQLNQLNEVNTVAKDRSAEIYNANRGDINWGRGELMGLYNGIDSGVGGGGGGGGYTPANFESTSLPFYQNLMNNGGYSEADKANELSYASGPISGLFEGLKRQLQSQSAGRGLPSYSSGMDRLARSQAYETGNMAKGVAAGLADRILQSKLAGASGTTDIEGQKRAFEAAERARRQAAANRGQANARQQFTDKRSLIDQILGLDSGNRDIAYQGNQLGSIEAGIGNAPKDNSTRNTAIGGGLAAAGTIAAALI